MNELGYFIKVLPITFVAYAIDKKEVSSGASIGLYGFAIEKCVKKIAKQIKDNDLSEARLDLIIEARGSKEDRKLGTQIIRFMRKPEYKSINFKGAEFQLKSSNL